MPGSSSSTSTIVFYKGLGDGQFSDSGIVTSDVEPAGYVPPVDGAAVSDSDDDLNGDGMADIVLTFPSATSRVAATDFALLRGQPDGTFIRMMSDSLTGFAETPYTDFGWTLHGDFDGDGVTDVLVPGLTDDSDRTLHWLTLSASDPSDPFFRDTDAMLAAGWNGFALGGQAADVNFDGNLDIVWMIGVQADMTGSANAGDPDPLLAIGLGRGDGTFETPSQLIPGTDGVTSFSLDDVDGDGAPDLQVALPTGMTVFYGDGTGVFLPPSP